jgi:tetratricopeptide (TPR) repeat protein
MAGSRDRDDGQSVTAGASQLYVRCVLAGMDTDQIQAELLRAYPRMHPLEARRHALNWSRRQLLQAVAQVLREREGTVSPLRDADLFEWERKGRVPLQYIDALCRALRCSAADIGFREYAADYRPQGTQNQENRTAMRYADDDRALLDAVARGAPVAYLGALHGPGSAAERHALRVDGRYVLVDRRTFMRVASAIPGFALLGAADPGLPPDGRARIAGAATGTGPVDLSLVADLRELLALSRRMDDRAGPRDLLDAVAGQVRMVKRLIPRADARTEAPLLSVAGELAQFAGWVAFDSGQHGLALAYYDQGRDWALAAGDWSLASYIDARRAMVATRAGDAQAAIASAKAAQHHGQVEDTVLAWAVRTEATAHAFAGDGRMCAAKLLETERLLDRADPDSAPSFIYHFKPRWELPVTRGNCFRYLGRGGDAVSAFTECLDAYPADRVRDRGVTLVWRALAYLHDGQPDAALADAQLALPIALDTGSARILDDLRTLRATALRRWPHTPSVRALDDLLSPLA